MKPGAKRLSMSLLVRIELEKNPGERVGVTLGHSVFGGVVVDTVADSSPLAGSLFSGDRIVEVNGTIHLSPSPAAVQSMAASPVISCVVGRKILAASPYHGHRVSCMQS